MSACRTSVVKLGGGAITFKDRPFTLDWPSLSLASSQLAEYRKQGGVLVAIVHGGGSFGHYVASKIVEARASTTVMVSKIQEAMDILSTLVTSALRGYGIPVTLHHPRSICIEPSRCDLTILKRDVEQGLVPVTHGDALMKEDKAIIISGDWLAAEIAVREGVDCLIYATRVGGVYGRGGNILRSLSSEGEVIYVGSEGRDVTGGIKIKVREALRASREGVRRVLITGVSDILPVLLGDDRGTLVVARE
ncbi:MAG: hypothetical protein F7B17_02135 [Desulfurococcales archaeon]|nr:hypothetical protein [Desulfurococcales archaeon]